MGVAFGGGAHGAMARGGTALGVARSGSILADGFGAETSRSLAARHAATGG